MSEAKLLAWQFDFGDHYDDGVQVVYAATEGEAELLAAQQSGGGPDDRSPVKHVPAFDAYVTAATEPGDNPTSEQFWDEGYTVKCWECEHPLSDEPCWRCQDELPSGEEMEMPVCSEGQVYCSQACLDALTERCAARKGVSP